MIGYTTGHYLVFVLSKANYLRVKVVLFLPSWHGVLHAGIAVVINTMAVVSMILILVTDLGGFALFRHFSLLIAGCTYCYLGIHSTYCLRRELIMTLKRLTIVSGQDDQKSIKSLVNYIKSPRAAYAKTIASTNCINSVSKICKSATDSETCIKKCKQTNENLFSSTSESRSNQTKTQHVGISFGLQIDNSPCSKLSYNEIIAAAQHRHQIREFTVRASIIKLQNLLIGFPVIMALACFMFIFLIIFSMRSLLKKERYSELIDSEASRFEPLSDLTMYVGIIIYAVFQWYATASRSSSKFLQTSTTIHTQGHEAKSLTPKTPVRFSLQRKSAVT